MPGGRRPKSATGDYCEAGNGKEGGWWRAPSLPSSLGKKKHSFFKVKLLPTYFYNLCIYYIPTDKKDQTALNRN